VEVSRIIAEIDSQISKLQQARALLSETGAVPAAPVKQARRGRPKGSKNSVKKAATVKATAPVKAAVPVKAKRKLSPEGRKAIAEAMKKRWAERRKVAAK
jgi:hypothetical protein